MFSSSNPETVIHFAIDKKIEVFISSFILWEIEKILKDKFKLKKGEREKIIQKIKSFSKSIKPKKKVYLIKECKDDNKILACAIASKANYLITGDKKHILPLKKIGKTKIVSPKKFLQEF